MKRKKIYRFLFTLVRDLMFLSVLGNGLSLFIIPLENWSPRIVLNNCLFSIAFGYPAMRGMMWITSVLEKRIPWLESPIKRVIYQFLALVFFSALVIFLGFYLWAKIYGFQDFGEVLRNVLPSLKVVYIFLVFSLVMGNTLLFFKNWKQATLQQEELKRAHLALQLQSLKDQIRPHFLFNSLSSLATLINTDTEKATRFVHKLSDVYRYVLEQRENELVTISQELRFLEDYMYLQKIRFGENLQIKYDVTLDQKRLIIPLSIQMLVENAIKHNEISKDRPLTIEVYSSGSGELVVKNNLQRKETTETSLGMGLENLKKQIAFFSDENIQVKEEDGTFLVRLPTFST